MSKQSIIDAHLHSLDFKEKEATPMEIALYLRMCDAMDAYAAMPSIEFIQKRVREQLQYIREVLESNRPNDRKRELVESAAGVLKYFNDKL